ncbi:unannotated protein [freshwater metagenome]|uniref:Unannotated protein n=1 Tax=freshwater metagenome TaxID=449393 RepID=A0A6J7IA24_9ZZZZ|nr:hypothetical protein [Actinomycetota bacterium]
MTYKKDSIRTRTPLAIALIAASFLSALFLATFSHRGDEYWVASVNLAPGHQILNADIELRHLDLDSSASLYLTKGDVPVGLVVINKVVAGQILSTQNVNSGSTHLAQSAVPISIRAVDLAAGIEIGEVVDIYWVIDSQNGEIPIEPELILGGVTLLGYDQKGNNFGTDVSLTIAVEETQVLRILSATAHGRLVVVRSHV